MSRVGKSYKKTVELRVSDGTDVDSTTLITLTNPASTEDFTISKEDFELFYGSPFLETSIVTTTPFTPVDEDIILVNPDTLGADITINLPDSSDRYDSSVNVGQPLTIKHIGTTGTYSVFVNPITAQQVEMEDDALILMAVSLTLMPDGAGWWVV